ncbi:glucosamine-6-phosphate deaminase [Labrenzia sp. EL_13]|nr:glucosamine-6-phosphate deaminase [Labrenzia sp. EL_13]
MRISVHETPEEIGHVLAGRIATEIQKSSAKGRPYLLGCPGGRSPKPVYTALAKLTNELGLDLSDLIIVMMDDYVDGAAPPFDYVDRNCHFSCRRFAFQDIAAVLNNAKPKEKQIQSHNIWFPDPGNAAAYDDRIAAAGGIDMFLLASGASDGHVAFNPPGTSRDTGSRVVRLAELTRQDNLKTFPDFNSLGEVPGFGVTIGVGTIARHSRSAAMILFGDDKKLAYQRISMAVGYDPQWPSTIVRECNNPVLYADQAAAGCST